MGLVLTDDRHYKAIADTIRENAPIEQSMTPAEMPDNIVAACEYNHDEGYSSGYETGSNDGYDDGYADGYDDGSAGGYTEEDIAAAIEQGKQAEYDRFWDVCQPSEVGDYRYKFCGSGWTAETFRPKRSIRPTAANQMFLQTTALNISLPEHLGRLGLELDFSRCATFSEMLLYSAVYEIGVVDTRAATTVTYLFRYAKSLVTVQNLILKDDGSQVFNNTSFQYMEALENFTVTGTFGSRSGGMDFSSSTKLSKASHYSIFAALSTTTSGLSITVSKAAVDAAFETSPGAKDGSTSAEWLELVATRPNWTITLGGTT